MTRVVVAVLAVLLLAGCTGPAGATAPAASAPRAAAPTTTVANSAAGLTVVLVQYRSDAARRLLQVSLRNDGPEPVTVLALDLHVPELSPVPPTPRTDELGPGNRLDLPVGYGDVRCDGPATAPSEVAVTLRRGAGPAQDLTVPVARPDATLDALVTEECGRQRVAAAVSLELVVDRPAARGRAVPATLVARRAAGTAPVVVTGVGESVLLGVAPARTDPVLTLDADEAGADVALTVTAARCDPHARADSKQAFVLPAWVRVAGEPEVRTTLTVGEATQAQLLDFLAVACAGG